MTPPAIGPNDAKMKTTGILLLFALWAWSFASCTRRPSAGRAAEPQEAGPALTAQAAGQPAPTNRTPGQPFGTVDSIRFEEGCAEYTCYFAAGRWSHAALETVRRILFDSPVCNVRLDERLAPEQAERPLRQASDSLAALPWPDAEPLQALRGLFGAWADQQLERDRIVHRAHYDPEYLLRCSESDSLLTRCAAIIRSGEEYVGQVRRLWREAGVRIAGDAEDELAGPDSLRHAKKRLLQLLSNHINHKIHTRLGDDGRVDFGRYADDFFRLFDSVRVESWEP